MSAAASCAAAAAQHVVGLGTFMMDRPTVPAAIRSALSIGYRRIDCAPVYFNEDIVGDALQEAIADRTVTREDLFVVSKLASPFHRREHVELAVRKTLSDLRLDYLDLYLVHWPVAFHPVDISDSITIRGWSTDEIDESDAGKRIDATVSIHETWQALEALVDQGLVRHIGVSNYPVALLHELMTQARIPPAINQCEAHPYLQQTKLVEYCRARGVHFEAYSPLGTPGFKARDEPVILDDPVLNEIATRHGISVAAVCLAWAVQRGTSVVAKSTNPQHQRDNLEAATSADIRLSEDEMAAIASLDRGYRYFRPEDWWGEMTMAVFD
jgi:alcohol dehydrogenase (NADP+)